MLYTRHLHFAHQLCQNLARQRAREFGKTDLVHALESPLAVRNSSSYFEPDDIVVTTEASEAEAESSAPSRKDDLKDKPRGFFADQFEVCLFTWTRSMDEVGLMKRSE